MIRGVNQTTKKDKLSRQVAEIQRDLLEGYYLQKHAYIMFPFESIMFLSKRWKRISAFCLTPSPYHAAPLFSLSEIGSHPSGYRHCFHGLFPSPYYAVLPPISWLLAFCLIIDCCVLWRLMNAIKCSNLTWDHFWAFEFLRKLVSNTDI